MDKVAVQLSRKEAGQLGFRSLESPFGIETITTKGVLESDMEEKVEEDMKGEGTANMEIESAELVVKIEVDSEKTKEGEEDPTEQRVDVPEDRANSQKNVQAADTQMAEKGESTPNGKPLQSTPGDVADGMDTAEPMSPSL